MFTAEQRNNLSAKLDAGNVKKNPKGFDYVEGWHAIAEANRIFGFDGWNREVVNLKSLHDPYQNEKNNWVVSYGCTVRIIVRAGDTTISRDGCGYGSGFSKGVGDAHESALKEAETDAMKRALMTFGNPFGLALYDKDKENVERTKPAPREEPKATPSAPDPEAEWKALAEQIKGEIDATIDTAAIGEILASKPFVELSIHNRKIGEWLIDRANKRAGTLSQKRAA